MRSTIAGYAIGLLAMGLVGAAGPTPQSGLPLILDLSLLPPTSEQGVQSFSKFLLGNANRAFAFGSNGAYGGMWGARTREIAQESALTSCAQKGAADCRLYAEGLAIVWPGHKVPVQSNGPRILTEGSGFALVPDERFFWYPPAIARGIVVWGHGYAGDDERGLQPPSFLRALNNIGYSVARFDRDPGDDAWSDLQTRHLRDGLAVLKAGGWKKIVAGGQSRGGWNALELLRTPGVADVIITTSAGPGTGTDVTTQIMKGQTMLYSLAHDVPSQTTRLAYIQFLDDPYGGNKTYRADLIRDVVRLRIGALLLIDQPPNFSGHSGAYRPAFATRYGECLKRFVEDAKPPSSC